MDEGEDGLVGNPNNGLAWKIIEISKSPTKSPTIKRANENSVTVVKTTSHAKDQGHRSSTSLPDKKIKKMLFSFTLQAHHSITRRGSKMYKCDVCGSTYHHVFSLKRHFLRNHVTVKYISLSDLNNCKINVLEKEKTSMSSDEKKSVTSPEKDSDALLCEGENPAMPGLYRCHFCKEVTFDGKKELIKHYEIHSNSAKTRFPCDKCSVVFSHKQALYRHLATHEGTKSFPCTTCGLQFDNKPAYLKHAATHTDGRTCKYCSKVLSTKANKNRHERIHQGLKPYPCKHCPMQFSQCGDLKDHVRKIHSMLYIICPDCPSLFSSKTALNKHRMDRHRDKSQTALQQSPLLARNSGLTTLQSLAVNVELQEKQFKTYPCPLCKKRYASYVGMLHHRRKIHPFAGRPRNKVHKRPSYFTRSVRQRLFRKHKETEVTEAEFYQSLSSMVANNLLHYVDGKMAQISLGQYNFSEPVDPYYVVPPQEWSVYNFPSSFDVEKALTLGGKEVENHFLENLKFPNAPHPYSHNHYREDIAVNGDLISSSSDESETEIMPFNFDYKSINIEERKKLIGRNVQSVFLCNVCKEKLPTFQVFEDHCNNNHPNVLCTSIEIEGDKDCPPVVPDELRRQFLSPVGQYFACDVPPTIEEQSSYNCTKCKVAFTKISDLHQHIISCAGHIKVSSFRTPKKNPIRKIKWTMKNRINTSIIKPKYSHTKSPNGAGRLSAPKTAKSSNLSAYELKMKPSVGRPKINLSIQCPHCKEFFRTKSLLSSHVSRCYKRLSLKKKCLNAFSPESFKSKTANVQEADKQIHSLHSSLLSTNQEPVLLPMMDTPSERLSPSLETIVNSIKEKLTAEELSPSVPSFSWMDDESIISTSNSSSLLVTNEIFSQCKLPNEGKLIIEPNELPICETFDAKTDLPSLDGKNELSNTTTDFVSNKANLNGYEILATHDTEKDFTSTNIADPVQDMATLDIDDQVVPSIPKKFVPKYKPKPNPYVKKRKRRSKQLKKIAINDNKLETETTNKEAPKDVTVVSESNIASSEALDDLNLDDDKPIIVQATRFVPETDSPPLVQTALPVKRFYKSTSVTSTHSSISDSSEDKQQYILKDQAKRGSLLCPHCLRYIHQLAMFHSHVKSCAEKPVQKSSPPPRQLVLPKKDEVEESVINLWRHQSRQSKMMKEAKADEDPNDVKNFQTYTCDSCHKIFFSLFKLLQHRVVHKLQKSEDQAMYSKGDSADHQYASLQDPISPSLTSPHPLFTNSTSHLLSIDIPKNSQKPGPSSAPIAPQKSSPMSLPVRLPRSAVTCDVDKRNVSQPSPFHNVLKITPRKISPALSNNKEFDPNDQINISESNGKDLVKTQQQSPKREDQVTFSEVLNAPQPKKRKIISQASTNKTSKFSSKPRKKGRQSMHTPSHLDESKSTNSFAPDSVTSAELAVHTIDSLVVEPELPNKKLKRTPPEGNSSVFEYPSLGDSANNAFVNIPKTKKKKKIKSISTSAETNFLNAPKAKLKISLPSSKRRKKRKVLNIRKHAQMYKKLAKQRLAKMSINESSPVANNTTTEDRNVTDSESSLLDASSSTMASTSSEFSIMETSFESPSSSASNVDKACPLCGKMFTSLNYKKRHMVIIHGVSSFPSPPAAKGITLKLKKIKKKKKMDLQRSALQRECKQRQL